MKVLLLFDVTCPVSPDLSYTPAMFLEEQRVAEANVLTSLHSLGHQVENMAVFNNVGDIVNKVQSFAPDVVFNQCETFRDDRSLEPNIPALLDMMRVRYTGSGPDGLLLCQDKALAREVLSHHRVCIPRFLRLTSQIAAPPPPALWLSGVCEADRSGICSGRHRESVASWLRDEEEAVERLRVHCTNKFNSDACDDPKSSIEGQQRSTSR